MIDPEHGRRISTLETDVNTLKLDVSTISIHMKTMGDQAEERHGILSTQQVRMMDLLEEREKEAREYRIRREDLEAQADLAHKQWLKSLVNPQTIVIVVAIALSLMGTRVADIQQVAAMVGTPIQLQPQPLPAPLEEPPAQ